MTRDGKRGEPSEIIREANPPRTRRREKPIEDAVMPRSEFVQMSLIPTTYREDARVLELRAGRPTYLRTKDARLSR